MIEVRWYDGSDPPDSHFHTGFELLYIQSGCVHIRVAGREYEASAPACVFFSNLEPHALSQAGPDYARYTVLLSPEEATAALKNPLLLSAFRNRPKDFCHVMQCEGRAPEGYLEAMLRESEREDGFREGCLQSLFYLLLAALYRQTPDFFPLARHACSDSILAVQQYLDEHFRENLSVQEVARQFFISPGYLQHRFTELVGCSPKQYLILSRLSAAQHMLLTTRLTVAEIAGECGFAEANNFIRRFAAHFGETPAQYRRNQAEQTKKERP